MKSASYRQASCCEIKDCFALDRREDQPCWGEVTVVDSMQAGEEDIFLHACEGHEGSSFGETVYTSESK